MEIPLNAQVNCREAPCGKSICVIIDPEEKRVTHVVVRENQGPHTERMVPLEWVESTTHELINLDCSREQFNSLEEFVEREYINVDEPVLVYAPDEFTYWPVPVQMDEKFIQMEHEQVPSGELALHRGSRVLSRDGKIGKVDDFLVDSNERITHIVLKEGHLWNEKEVSIPVEYIDHLEEDAVYLKLGKQEVNVLAAGKPLKEPEVHG